MQDTLIKGPFKSRKASKGLKEQLLVQLANGRYRAGEPFYSDARLMNMSGLSRKTVRKALDDLQREGWIERFPGKGSFVGPRVAAGIHPSRTVGQEGGQSVIRIAVLAFGMSGDAPDWYSQGVLAGLDDAAAAHAVSIELLGSAEDRRVFAQRLARSQPDILVVMPAKSQQILAIAEAERLGIPSLLVGTRLLDLEYPSVCEDGVQGAAMAVKHLVAKGHRRIGLLQRPDAASWVFDRHEGYRRGLLESGLEIDESLVVWLPFEHGTQCVERLAAYYRRYKPTALLLTSGWHVESVARFAQSEGLAIPEDLSLVTFDQYYLKYQTALHMRPTVVELPLREIGRRLARLACDVVAGKEVEHYATLPCELVEGASVKVLNA